MAAAPADRAAPAAAELRNDMAGQASPYLALHARDPVAWRLWNADTLAEARRRNLPLLVSVGFFTCHWCHVLQRESFRHPVTAALINRSFIAVKVDREIDGALDAALQDFSQRRIGRRGWPLQVLVTPQGYPAEAGLYERPTEFHTTLSAWAQRWRADPAALSAAARALVPPPHQPAAGAATTLGPELARTLREQFVTEAMARADSLQGGFGNGARFAAAPQLLALLELGEPATHPPVDEFLRLTLEQVRTQGLRDHVWGGFFRYTVDPAWREPHFEKMLADNAMLALLCLRAGARLRWPELRDVGLQTLRFMQRELWDDRAGAFAAGLSALGGDGAEGSRYLWPAAQLASLLPADERASVAAIWNMDVAASNPLGYLPMQARSPSARQRRLLERAYGRLRASRAAERAPRDAKLLAGWNGLALAALAEAGAADAGARQALVRLRRFINRALWDGQVLRKLAGAGPQPPGELDDYAFVAWGLARAAAVGGDAQAATLGAVIARAAWSRFFGDGWRQQEKPLLAGLSAEAVVADTALPSGSASLILASLELNQPDLLTRAHKALELAPRAPARAAFVWATHAMAAARAVPVGRS